MARTLPLIALAAWLGGTGCDARPKESTAEVRPTVETAAAPRPGADPLNIPVPRAQPTKPDIAKITYDRGNRKLAVYDLPDPSARWMLTTPTVPMGLPIEREYQFPPGMELDLDSVSIFYTVPNCRPSPTVSLREILDSRSRQ